MPTENNISPNDPAFPVMPPVDEIGDTLFGYPFPHPGMTLRQWYAGMAMKGFCAHNDYGTRHPDIIAEIAVDRADALIAKLSKAPK